MPDIVEEVLLRNKRKKVIVIDSYKKKTGFVPADIANFLAWWTYDASTFTYGTGSAIERWTAKEGTYYAEQLDTAKQPVDNLSGVEFDGIDDLLKSTLTLNGETSFSVVVYFTWLSGGATSVQSVIGNETSNFYLSNYMRESDGLLGFTLDTGGGAVNNQITGSGIAFNTMMLTLEYSSGVFKKSYIGTTKKIDSTQSGSVNMPSSNLIFGARRENGNQMKGRIHDVAVYNGVLSDLNRQSLFDFFTS